MRQDTNAFTPGDRLGKKVDTLPPKAPALRAVSFLKTEVDPPLLTDRQREELARIGSRLRLPARTVIYREAAASDAVFAIAEGVVKTYRDMPSGKRVVTAFLFDRDLFGLAQKGKYVNAAQAITRVTLYRLPIKELTVLLKHDSDMQFQFLVKVTHALRESQRRGVLVGRRDAAGRLAMFIALMAEQGGPGGGRLACRAAADDAVGYRRLSQSVSRKRQPRECRVEAEGTDRVRRTSRGTHSRRAGARQTRLERVSCSAFDLNHTVGVALFPIVGT